MIKTLPVLPLKDTVVFPELVVPLAVGREKSLAAIEAAMESGREFIAVAQQDPDLDNPTVADLFEVGTIVKITRVEKQEGGAQVIVQGDRRVRLLEDASTPTYLSASCESLVELNLSEAGSDSHEIDALITVPQCIQADHSL